MWRRRARRAEQQARIEAAKNAAGHARAQTEISRERHEDIHQRIIGPMWQAGEHNQFAQLIRKTLIDGYGDPG